jgi:hypothetical protein
MNKICKTTFGTIICLMLCSSQIFAAEKLSLEEAKILEAKIRHVAQIQRQVIENNLLRIGGDLDQFLFGPGTTDKLLRFYNKRIKTEQLNDDEAWKKFQQEVLPKENFDRFTNELIEIHFRLFDKTRREVNREFIGMGLKGVPEMNFEVQKKELRLAIDAIWNTEYIKLEEIIQKSIKETDRAKWVENADNLIDNVSNVLFSSEAIYGATIWLLKRAGITIACPVCIPVLFWVTVATFVGYVTWKVYKYNTVSDVDDVQQRFMKNMTERLKIMSTKIKAEFKVASDKTMAELFNAIYTLISEQYPLIRKEDLL